MSSALLYVVQNGLLNQPLSFPTKTGQRCGHYEQVTTPSGSTGYRFYRDPNAFCGLPVAKSTNVAACGPNGASCARAPLPAGWTVAGQQRIAEAHPAPAGRRV